MGKFIQQVLATVVGLVLFLTLGLGGLLVLVAIAAAIAETPRVGLKNDSILTLDLTPGISDAHGEDPGFLATNLLGSGSAGEPLSLRVATDAIATAAKDDHITALYLQGSLGSVPGYATLQELRQALVQFQTSGKPIYAYSDGWVERDYYLTSVADQVFLNPNGLMELNGLRAENVFFANALKKFGVGIQVLRAGQFKSAVEPFIRNDSSPQEKQQTLALLTDVWQEFLTTVAASRELQPGDLQAIADQQALLPAEQAKAAGLVDQLAYEDEVLDKLQTLTGAKDLEDLHQISVGDYAAEVDLGPIDRISGKQVALVYLNGEIVGSSNGVDQIGSDRTVKLLRELRQNDDVKAVVLRIDSPGGSSTASALVAREVKLLHDTKPTIASMGNIAASGGYQIATYAHTIFASPTTITGSIGVFGLLPNVQELANKNGITWDGVQTGRYADIDSIARPKTPEELTRLQAMVDQVYTSFLTMVATSRSLPIEKVREIAQGRVWSGSDAKQIGLVDQLGGLDSAIQTAVQQAELGEDWQLVEYPKPSLEFTLLTSLLDRSQVATADPIQQTLQHLQTELSPLQNLDDPWGIYARMSRIPQID